MLIGEDTPDQQVVMMNLLDVINPGGHLEDVIDVDEMLRYFCQWESVLNRIQALISERCH